MRFAFVCTGTLVVVAWAATAGLGCVKRAATAQAPTAVPAPASPSQETPEDPRAKAWAAIAQLPDWSGVWNPNITDQNSQIKTNPVPWNLQAAAEVAKLGADEKEGHPKGLFVNCLPEGMPAWMLISHNALEFLFTPGRVTILGESDGNRLRRIYTDRPEHSPDPDPSFHGDSIGHWEGDTLVVDTVAVLPQTFLAVSEAVGVPNDGDLHVVERFHVGPPDILRDDIEITAPHVLTAPWKTTRSYFRQRARKYELVEGVCQQGYFSSEVDKAGHSVFVPIPQTEDGNPVAAAAPKQPAKAGPKGRKK
jgi:hypothetical protein